LLGGLKLAVPGEALEATGEKDKKHTKVKETGDT
jgi:hypothetical protein